LDVASIARCFVGARRRWCVGFPEEVNLAVSAMASDSGGVISASGE